MFVNVGRESVPHRQSPRATTSTLHDVHRVEFYGSPNDVEQPHNVIVLIFGIIPMNDLRGQARESTLADERTTNSAFEKFPKKHKNRPVGIAVVGDRPDYPKNSSVTIQTTPYDLSLVRLIFPLLVVGDSNKWGNVAHASPYSEQRG